MRAYKVIDVFSKTPFQGNPVAVVLDAEGLCDAEMQGIARWTNLSETTFFLPPTQPGADYQLRIFTPRSELPFAGHPTLGSAHAALEAGRISLRGGLVVQQCAQGLIPIRIDGDGNSRRLVLELPKAKVNPLDPCDLTELEAAIGQVVDRNVAPAVIDVGAVWIVAKLTSSESLLSLKPDFVRSALLERKVGATGISLFASLPTGSNAAIEVRSFAPSCGVDEDPVCGSGNGSIAVFQSARGLIPNEGAHYVASQGQQVGRSGRVQVWVDAAGGVKVGGACVTCAEGLLKA